MEYTYIHMDDHLNHAFAGSLGRSGFLCKHLSRYVSILCILVSIPLPVLFAGKADEVKKMSFELINEGVSLYNKGEYWDAIQRLERASNMALNSFLAHYYLGLSLSASKRYSEAIEPLKVAIDLNPNHIQAHIALGDTYLKLGDHEEALAEYYRALSIGPNYAPAYDGIGRYYESIANKEKAIENFKKAIELNKGYPEAYLHIGDLYLRDGKLDEAIAYLSEAIAIRPDFAEGLNRLGTAFARLKLYDKAMITIKKAIDLSPREAIHYQALGEIFLELRQLQQATSSFEKALSLDGSLVGASIGLAEVLRLEGNYEAAKEILERAQREPFVDSQLLAKIEDLMIAYESEQNLLTKLLKDFDEGTIDPGKMRELARLFASKGDYPSAASIISKSPEIAERRELMEEYGYYLLKSGQYGKGGKVLEELIEKFGADPTIFINIGISYSAIGNYEEAMRSFLKALESQPDNLTAVLSLANAQLRMGNIDEAEKYYSQYIGKGGTGPDAERIKEIITLLKDKK